MNKTKKILIGIIILFVLLWVGTDIYRNRNLDFEYKEYDLNTPHFNLSLEYKQYLSDEINEDLKKEVPEEIKKVFDENNLFIPHDARMSRFQEEAWEIRDGVRRYAIRDTGKCLEISDIVQRGRIKSIEWNDNALVVDARVGGTGCDITPYKFTVDYKRVEKSRRLENNMEKNIIYLFVSERTSIFSPECIGAYDFRFKIKNLEPKYYTIRLYKKSDLTERGFYLVEEKTYI